MYTTRIAIIGNGGSGKSECINRILFKDLKARYIPTEMEMQCVYYIGGDSYSITDIIGENHYDSKFSKYDCVVIIFDNLRSYNNISRWTKLMPFMCVQKRVLLIRNKIDIIDNALDTFVSTYRYNLPIIGVSTKTGQNCDEILKFVYENIVRPKKINSIIGFASCYFKFDTFLLKHIYTYL